MKHIELKEVLIGLAAFIVISFLAKLVLLAPIVGFFMSFSEESANLPLIITLGLLVSISGFVVGVLVGIRVKVWPLYHGLVVGVLVVCYKVIRPEFYPLSTVAIVILSLLTFTFILVGTYWKTSKT